jgi:hypothetical protein
VRPCSRGVATIRPQPSLLALLFAVVIAALLPPSEARAEICPTPTTEVRSGGVIFVIEPDLCELTLVEGPTVIRWERPAQSPDDVFTGYTEPALEELSVWRRGSDGEGWSTWGPMTPTDFPAIEQLEPGEIYFIAAPAAGVWDLRPHPTSVFDGQQVVSFYGYPGIPSMGALGRYSAAGAIAAANVEVARYDALNGDIDVVAALHPIVAVAQPTPMSDGTYLVHMPESVIATYVEAAREAGALVILDIQIGWADPLEEVRRLERFLLEPFVHIALDPEFATASLGVAPGQLIGNLPASDINAVQDYLASLVREHELPPKALVIHQFQEQMIRDPQLIQAFDEVDITVDMDGFGSPVLKTRHYEWFSLADHVERPAIKLFYNWDTPLMEPAELQAFEVPPALIIYQ